MKNTCKGENVSRTIIYASADETFADEGRWVAEQYANEMRACLKG